MKKTSFLVKGALLLFLIGMVSCEPESISKYDDNEFNAIDKEEVEDPDDRGNS